MNACTLKENGVPLGYNGTCGTFHYKTHNPPLICDCKHEGFAPICSSSGYNYENKCVLHCTQ